MSEKGKNKTRRRYMKTVGALTAIGLGSSVPTAKGNSDKSKGEGPPTMEDFKVEGTKKTKTKYTEDTIVVTEKYHSPDLARRYDVTPPTFEKTTDYDRAKIEDDNFPESGTETEREPWNSHFATGSEWEELHKGKKEDNSGNGNQGAAGSPSSKIGGPRLDHAAPKDEDREGEHPDGFAVWDYKRVDEADNFWSNDYAYYTTSPINVIFPDQDLSTVDDVLNGQEGWDQLDSYLAQQHKRYAWDKDAEAFVIDDDSFGNTDYGINGRYHVRCWENENDVVAIQAHHDDSTINDSFGHQVDSYEDCEQEIADIFGDHGFEHRTTYYMDNDKDDHDGSVTLLTET